MIGDDEIFQMCNNNPVRNYSKLRVVKKKETRNFVGYWSIKWYKCVLNLEFRSTRVLKILRHPFEKRNDRRQVFLSVEKSIARHFSVVKGRKMNKAIVVSWNFKGERVARN